MYSTAVGFDGQVQGRRWGVSGAPLLGLGLGARRRQALRRAVCSLWRTLPRSCSRSRSMMGSRWRPRRWRRSRLIAWRTQSPTGIAGRAPAGRRRSVIGERHLFLFLVSLAPEMWVTPPRPVAHQLVGGYNAMLGPIAPHFCCMVCSRDAQIATGIGTWIAHVSGSSRFNIGTLSQTMSLPLVILPDMTTDVMCMCHPGLAARQPIAPGGG